MDSRGERDIQPMSAFRPMSQRTNLRKKMREARKKSSLSTSVEEVTKRAQIFHSIQIKTGMPKKEVEAAFEEFCKTCPTGVMSKKKFIGKK